MYQVNIGNKILYYPGSEEAQIFATELNEEIGLAGEFKFEVPPDNPVYSELSNGKLVTILKNGDEYWRGEIRDVKTDFAKIASVYVVEDLAWLADEYMTPAQITNETNAQRLQAAITAYNSVRSATPERQFLAGYITNVSSSGICNWTTEYEWSILESLRNCIANSASEPGYIRVRRQKENGVIKRYIDIVKLSDYGVASDQPIEYGYNLLDYVKDSDYGNLTNVLTPYGEELENQEVYEDYAQRLQGNTITNAASVSTYGRHAKAVVFDGVTDATTLNALAASYLSRYCQPQLTMEVQAVDLAEIESADAIKLGDSVQIIAKPFAIDQRLYLTQIRRDIQNIDKNVITMSGHVLTGKTLTSQLVGTAKAVENIPSESSILKAAKKNALAMLLDETQGGYVVFEYDANNANMIAINICNAKTIAASTKRWRWAQNGFGYMYRANTSSAWTGPTVAMTMDGAIVADFITTGTLIAQNNKFELNMTNGKVKMQDGEFKGSISGSSISGGTISGGAISGGTISGTSISGGTITGSEINSEESGKKIKISGSDVQLFGSSGAGFVRIYEGSKHGSFYDYEFGISSHYSHAAWNSGGTYLQVSSHEIIEAADSYSDERLKQNIRIADDEVIKELILGAQIKQFERTYDPEHGRFGVIAQDVRAQVDKTSLDKEHLRLTMTDDEGYFEIDYKEYIPMLMRMVQIQNTEIENIKKELSKLKGETNG